MNTLQHDTVILLFAQMPEQQIRFKTFTEEHGPELNKQAADLLLQHTLFVAKGSGIPLVVIYPERQEGSNFGERLANAFQEVYSMGYQRVICIGADCVDLTPADLLLAQDALSKGRMVVGPGTNGGAYLVGLHIDCFDPEALAMLNWQTDELLNELVLYGYRMQASMGSLTVLDEKTEAGSGADLSRQLNILPVYHHLHRQLSAILS
ncbi:MULTISPECIES: DUF2064 domain-containing protein [Pontibacter]|uniref:DUF2064 domain-containing protein n=1 Tax=Pontibacter lucknowensis TaxID=1077936 RepID=A0A1N6ZB64_9BACT|nr:MULTISPECIES: DUF2064 domain-containing protein [Pontibacter]EJF11897.1 hypothetical protein O71_00025 [Pontibacter sp. BAB1700]SIR23986.1 hypothetical protein SAMN05421545_2871 [Pontibacter lucknowensis]